MASARNNSPAIARAGTKRKQWNRFKLFLYALPAIILVFMFHYLPLWGWSFAFFQYKPGKSLWDCAYVGWNNFTTLFGNVVMRRNLFRVLTNTFGIHFLGYLFSPLPLLFAVFLSEMRSRKFQKFVQSLTHCQVKNSFLLLFHTRNLVDVL